MRFNLRALSRVGPTLLLSMAGLIFLVALLARTSTAQAGTPIAHASNVRLVPGKTLPSASLSSPGAWETIAEPIPWNTGNELVALSDGRLLYLGGGYASSAYGASDKVYEYDPTTNRWTAKSPMLEARRALGAAVIDDLVYAIGGGEYEGENPTNTVERFDPQANTWTYVSPMNFKRSRIGATAFGGKIYVFGGLGESGLLDSIEVYDPILNIWLLSDDTLPELPTGDTHNCGVTAVASVDRIYVFIGWGTFQSPHLWAYDPNAPAGARWTQKLAPSLGFEWGAPEPNAAAFGRLLSYMPANSSEGDQSFGLFDTTTGQWTQVASPQRDGHSGGASVGTDGYVYAIGGYTYGPKAERYDPRKVLEITSPTTGSIYQGVVRILGSADRTDLNSYRFYWKLAQEPDSSFQPVGPARTTPVLNGELEMWDTIALDLGRPIAQYTLKLEMVDTTGLFTDTVVQQIIIDNTTMPDTHEPNDTCGEAYQIDPGTQYQSYISRGQDADYYKFVVPDPHTTINVTLNHDSEDYDLAIYYGCTGDTGQIRHIGQIRHVGQEFVSYNVGTETGTFYVQVTGYNGAFSQDPYTLRVDLNPDVHEPDDTCTDAQPIATGTPHEAYLSSPTDVDYYHVEVPDPYTTINVTLTHATRDYDVSIYYDCSGDTGQIRHVGQIRHIGQEQASYNVGGETGTFYIQVSGFDGAYSSQPYTITVSLREPQAYEPNGDCTQAYGIQPGITYASWLTPTGDIDYYRFYVDQPYTTIRAVLYHATEDYDATIHYDCSGGTGQIRHIGQIRHVGEEVLIYNAGAETGWYYVAVEGFEGASSDTPYTLRVDLNPDAHEPDDTCGEAYQISPDTLYQSYLSSESDIDYYAIYIAEPYTTISVTMNHPYQDYDVALYYDCAGDTGQIRHIGQIRHVGEEVFSFKTGTETGWYYIQVVGYDGAYSPVPYTLQVTLTTTDPTDARTLVITNRQRLEDLYGTTAVGTLWDTLTNLVDHPQVQGLLLDVQDDPTVATAYADWDANPGSSNRANAVAQAIKDFIINQLRDNPNVRYLVLVGDDRVIPFYRLHIYPYRRTVDPDWARESLYAYVDNSTTVGAAIKQDMTLTDDFYADFTPQEQEWAPHLLFIPDYPIGRLVETPQEMGQVISAFLNSGGVTDLQTATVAGWTFVKDAAQGECNILRDHGVTVDCDLISSPPWGPPDLRQRLLDAQPDLAAFNGHASHFSYQAPNLDSFYVSEVSDGPALSNTLVYVLGCQAGLNVPENNPEQPGDFPQAFLGRGAAYISNTGWGYGFWSSLGLSEKLMVELTEQLLEVGQPTIGDALVRAKQQYWLEDRDFTHYDEKILVEATLYGLPMLQVTSSGIAAQKQLEVQVQEQRTVYVREIDAATQAQLQADQVILSPAMPSGLLKVHRDIEFPWATQVVTPTLTENGSYYDLNDQIHAEDSEPIQPLYVTDLSNSFGPVHSVLFVGGVYHDQPNFDPVVERAGDLNRLHQEAPPEPEFDAPNWYPAVPHAFNGLATLGNRQEHLASVVGQFSPIQNTERLYTTLSFDVYYSNSLDFEPPAISDVSDIYANGTLTITTTVTDTEGILRVVVTYTDGGGVWESVDLTAIGDDRWEVVLPVPANVEYLIQAVDSNGNASLDDNAGTYYKACSLLEDVNPNCKIDIGDVQAVAGRWRLTAANPDPDGEPATLNYAPRFDLDNNGVINIVDIMLVAARWGAGPQ